MKRFLSLLTITFVLALAHLSCTPEAEEFGSIYGIVTDKATGEPVKNANVQLQPTGETSLAGNDGRYEFLELKNGNYSIKVSKTNYTDLIDDYIITVDGSKAMRRDVQIEKLPNELRIVDGYGNDINELDFGSMNDDNSRMFNIFNDGTKYLNYEILKTASWITSINPAQGGLEPGATKPVIINIDRSKLAMGDNVTTISITTNEGGKPLNIKAHKAGNISTLSVLDITTHSALLRGSVNVNTSYSERGFYYGDNVNTENKQVISGYGTGEFSYLLTNLEMQKTYYCKAYMKVNGETLFGNMMSFTTLSNDDDNNGDDDDDNNGDGNGSDNNHEYVDLAMPSGVKWATCNIGANSPEKSGDYFAWGETSSKYIYDENTSTTYCIEINDISGNPEYDAARKQWGSDWRLPTKEEYNELKTYCTLSDTIINSIDCSKVTGPNGNYIIFPKSGRKLVTSIEYGYYTFLWTSDPYYGEFNNGRAICAQLQTAINTIGSPYSIERYYGMSIRPVISK